MTTFICNCNFCKSNNNNNPIIWKRGKLYNTTIVWKWSNIITCRGYSNNKLVSMWYIWGYYHRINYCKQAKQLPYIFYYIIKCIDTISKNINYILIYMNYKTIFESL